MTHIKRLSHVAVVVDDIESALTFWRDALGFQLHHQKEVPEQSSVVAFLPIGESELELVKPTTADSGVGRFLQKRGPGMHHLCLEVQDLEILLNQLTAKGIRLINNTPVLLESGKKIAFIHPESANGVLVELYEI